jgi:thioredoxin reductase (NADPH)
MTPISIPKVELKDKKYSLSEHRYEIIIIGAGPAGLTAGIYASRANRKTLIIEQALPGGQMINTDGIENYPGFPILITGAELSSKFEEQAKKLKVDFIWGKVNKFSILENEKIIETEDKKNYYAPSVIIASGGFPRKLNIPGEEEFRGRGVSYCATCDGPFFRDKEVMVVGGGDSALDEAVFLSNYTKKIIIVHRRGEFRASKVLQQKVFNIPKIEYVWHSVVEEISGTDRVEEVVLKNVLSAELKKEKTEGIFIYVGFVPNSDTYKDLLKTDENGYILTDANMHTSLNGVFAAGDVRQKSIRQITTAVADGTIAAISADRYLSELHNSARLI